MSRSYHRRLAIFAEVNSFERHTTCGGLPLPRHGRAGAIRAQVLAGELGGYLAKGSGRWSCSCPDHRRCGAACKHALAAWALWRADAWRSLAERTAKQNPDTESLRGIHLEETNTLEWVAEKLKVA